MKKKGFILVCVLSISFALALGVFHPFEEPLGIFVTPPTICSK